MLVLVALAIVLGSTIRLPQGVDPPPPQEKRTPAPTQRQILEAELSRLPLVDLIRRQPVNPWDGSKEVHLLPEVQELMHRANSGSWSDDDWRTALTESDMIHTRPKWPANVPLEIGFGTQGWLRLSKITVRAVEPSFGEVSFDDRHPSWCGNCRELDIEMARHSLLGEFPSGTTRVVFEVTVLQLEGAEEVWAESEKSRLLWKGRLERPIQAVASSGDVLPATNKESETAAIRSSLRAFLPKAPGDPDELAIIVHGNSVERPALRGLGISLTVELWRAEEKVQSKDLVACRRGIWMSSPDACEGWAFMPGLMSTLKVPNVDLSRWQLRIRGNPTNVPGIWEADRWWNGSFSMPLADALKAGER